MPLLSLSGLGNSPLIYIYTHFFENTIDYGD